MLGKSTHLTGRARLSAKKSDRKGGMLLLVVIIMAVALILITSALTITTAARNRYYNTALTDQATITATSVAKTIGAAVEKGDITLTEIETLAGANGGAGTVIPVTSATAATKTAGSAGTDKTKAAAPGLYNDTSRSYTSVLVKYFTNSAGKKLIQIQATTGLDVNGAASTKTQTETVYLEKITVGPPGGAFASLFMCGTPTSNNNLSNVVIGTVPTGKTAESNYIVLNGNIGVSNSGSGGQNIWSDVIFTGQLTTGAGNTYHGNVVFYGNKASIKADVSKGDAINTPGMILFLGGSTGKQNAFTADPATAAIRTNPAGSLVGDAGIYFYNTLVKYGVDSNWMNSANGIYGDAGTRFEYTSDKLPNPNSGKVYLSTAADLNSYYMNDTTKLFKDMNTPGDYTNNTYITAMKTEANRIKTDMAAAIARTIPNPTDPTSTFYEDYGIKYKTETEIKAANATQLDTELTGASGVYKDPVYYINVSATNHVGDQYSATRDSAFPTYPENLTVLKFDLTSNDITIYIYGNSGNGCDLYFGSGVFQFVNGGAHIGRIVLMPGVNLVLNKNNTARDNGIIGTVHTITKAVPQESYCNTDALPKPFLYIYGINNNEIYANINSTIEGYIGLYGANGKFTFDNGPKFYGRLEVTNINPTNSSSMVIKYCPSPTENGSGGGSTTSTYVISGYQAT